MVTKVLSGNVFARVEKLYCFLPDICRVGTQKAVGVGEKRTSIAELDRVRIYRGDL